MMVATPPELGDGVQLPEELTRVHMIGIGGAGMSGLARILLSRGAQVSGSDAKDSRGVLALRARGAKILVGHASVALDQLEGGPTVVVSTLAAIPPDNPELVEARARGVRIIMRPTLLAELMSGHRNLLIAGTHGKTSTTSMVVVAVQRSGLDPSFAIGGELNESGTNAHHGSGSIFIAEADESDGSFLEYSPDVAVVTNIDVDHLDFFGTREAYVKVFDRFAGRISDGGALIVCLDDPGSAAFAGRVAPGLRARGIRILGYGRGTYADRAPDVENVAELLGWTAQGAGGVATVRLQLSALTPATAGPSVVERSVAVGLPGEHMALNALGAVVGAVCVGGDLDAAVGGVETFGGVHRRFEFVGEVGSVAVYDDYAHHPSEIRAVLKAARAMVGSVESSGGSGRVIAVFQPHLYSRTEIFADEFANALAVADEVVVLDVYAAREAPVPGISGRTITDRLAGSHFQPDMSAVADQVAALARPGDLILTLGAGDITMIGPEIVAALTERVIEGGGDA